MRSFGDPFERVNMGFNNRTAYCSSADEAAVTYKNKASQFHREADWLAGQLGKMSCHMSTSGPDCPNYHERAFIQCLNCWREVARKMVEDD